MTEFQLIIIGAGPAGLSAAIHAKRLGLDFIILEKGVPGGQAVAAGLIENYPGFPNGITGAELMDRFVEQARTLGIEIQKANVRKVSKKGKNEYFVETDKGSLCCGAIILAIGLMPLPVSIPGALYYPDPNKILHDGKKILVIGGGDAAFDEGISFSKRASSVTIAMRSDKPKALQRLVDRAKKAGVIIKTGIGEKEIANFDIVVACVGKRQELGILAPSLLPGIFLAGDVLHPDVRHIAAAVGDGVNAVEKITYENYF